MPLFTPTTFYVKGVIFPCTLACLHTHSKPAFANPSVSTMLLSHSRGTPQTTPPLQSTSVASSPGYHEVWPHPPQQHSQGAFPSLVHPQDAQSYCANYQGNRRLPVHPSRMPVTSSTPHPDSLKYSYIHPAGCPSTCCRWALGLGSLPWKQLLTLPDPCPMFSQYQSPRGFPLGCPVLSLQEEVPTSPVSLMLWGG